LRREHGRHARVQQTQHAVFAFTKRVEHADMRSTHRSRQVLQARGAHARARAGHTHTLPSHRGVRPVCARLRAASRGVRSRRALCGPRLQRARTATRCGDAASTCGRDTSLLLTTPPSIPPPRHPALAKPAAHCCSASCIHAWRQRAMASATPHCAHAAVGKEAAHASAGCSRAWHGHARRLSSARACDVHTHSRCRSSRSGHTSSSCACTCRTRASGGVACSGSE
jgi:hypothetical protein